MRPGRPSETAFRIAASRVVAARDPHLRPLLSEPDEPYSEWFVRAHSARARLLLALWSFGPLRRLAEAVTEATYPGGRLHILLRKRWVEDTLRRALEGEVRQVVLFGAGLDPLALRLAARFPEVRFFEIDHPATQAVKRRALERHGVRTPALRLHPADLSREAPDALLARLEGFDPSAPGAFVAEGLLMYLEPAVVESLFAALRRCSAAGSSLLFSLVDAAELANPESLVARSARALERLGEPLRWTLERRRIEPFLRRHGFRSRAVADSRALRAAYLAPAGVDRPLLEGELLVEAVPR